MPNDCVKLIAVRNGEQNGGNGEDYGVYISVEGDLDFEDDVIAARSALKHAYDQIDNVLDSIIKGAS